MSEDEDERFDTDDFVYHISGISDYLEILQWLKDNNVWYHSVYHKDSVATYELLYMDEEDVVAFKLRWM